MEQQSERPTGDDVLFQEHFLSTVPGSGNCVLIFRNLMPSTTVNDLHDSPATRKIMREMADYTSLRNPVLRTEGLLGFEV